MKSSISDTGEECSLEARSKGGNTAAGGREEDLERERRVEEAREGVEEAREGLGRAARARVRPRVPEEGTEASIRKINLIEKKTKKGN